MAETPVTHEGGAVSAAPPDDLLEVRRSERLVTFLRLYGVITGLIASIIIFSLLKPSTFPTLDNARSMLTLAAPLAVVAIGLTAVLILGDFDLSFASLVGLCGVVAVVLMVNHGVAWPLAVLAALGVGLAGGFLNGFVVSVLGAPSFIATLAIGTIFTGIEFQISGQETIFGGVPDSYASLARERPFFEIPLQVWWALAVAVVAWLFLQRSETGRYMYATGSNREAAELSGLSVTRLRIIGFMVVGLAAAIAGILLTAQSAASTPNQGQFLLLPAFAAAFIGSAMSKNRLFIVWGTVLGVLFLQIISTGLTMLALDTAQVLMVQGAILVGAILLSLLGRKR